nr:major allergen pru ar 1 [Quercus suber]
MVKRSCEHVFTIPIRHHSHDLIVKSCVIHKYVKHRIDEIDHVNFTYCYSVIEGDALSEVLEKISYEIKIVASPDGGSILKSTSKYHTKGEHEIKEEQVKAGKEKAAGLFKAIESYLSAHPDAYN